MPSWFMVDSSGAILITGVALARAAEMTNWYGVLNLAPTASGAMNSALENSVPNTARMSPWVSR